MIEVEVKCQLSPEQERKLLEQVTFVSQETLVDVYYDLPNFALVGRNWWLRTRNGRFLLKVPAMENGGIAAEPKNMPRYEFEDEVVIAQHLGLDVSNQSLSQALKAAGYEPFFSFTHLRRKYKHGDIIIDLDRMDFGDFSIDKCEFELMVEAPAMVEAAHQTLCDFAHQFGISTDQPVGKMVLLGLIERVKPDTYKRIMAARAGQL
jgi:adenylate cyclase class IV